MRARSIAPMAFAVIFFLVALVAAPVHADQLPARGQGTIVTESVTNAVGTRQYQVYTPDGGTRGRPLFVWLHGASKMENGDPQDLQRTSTLLRKADQLGYAVVAP